MFRICVSETVFFLIFTLLNTYFVLIYKIRTLFYLSIPGAEGIYSIVKKTFPLHNSLQNKRTLVNHFWDQIF
jgi:hypothetical protein